MGHANSKQRAEVEKIIREVKDIESYMKRNSEDFDDECRDNLHKRLIEYSTALQEILSSGKKKHSKELRELLDYINRVVEDIYRPKSDVPSSNNSTLQTSISVHVTPQETKLSASNESLNKENSRRSSKSKKKDLISQEKYRLPSLEEITNKTFSMKKEVETSIQNEDINQLLLQQKIIQILATDLEMLIFETHSPLQETKEALEKDLSFLYRRIEKAKRKCNESARSRQQKVIRENENILSEMNTRLDQTMSLAHILIKEKKYQELINARDEVVALKSKLVNMADSNERIRGMKVELEQKLDKVIFYLNKEIDLEQSSAVKIEGTVNKSDINSANMAEINSKIDQAMGQARALTKERKFSELLAIKNQILAEKSKLEKLEESEETSEAIKKIMNTLDYLENQMEVNGVTRKIKKTKENLARAEGLIEECRSDIINFGHMTDQQTYATYNNHLDGLQNFLDKITIEDNDISEKKSDCLRKIIEIREILTENFEKYNGREGNKVNPEDIRNLNTSTSSENLAVVEDSEKLDPKKPRENDDVMLRKKEKSLKVQFNNDRNIDGFYVYWKSIQSNLPSSNCSLEELQQIAILLLDLEEQIRAKRLLIEHFLQAKVEGKVILKSKEDLNSSGNIFQKNKNLVDNIDGPMKTNVKILQTDEPKKLIIDDDEIFQNIDEINKYSKKIEKQVPEKVIISSDNDSNDGKKEKKDVDEKEDEYKKQVGELEASEVGETRKEVSENSSGSMNIEGNTLLDTKIKEKIRITDRENLKNKQHVECITQVQNISRDVDYLKEKASSFSGTKQTPRYMDIKNKLDSYRKTLNILISYQNESITLSCNRVLENINEVTEILNKNTEKQLVDMLRVSPKRNTIETLFTDLMETKADVEEIYKKIEEFEDATESDEYLKLRNTLLKNREIVANMRISKNFENVAIAKADVLQQIEEGLYNLDMKLEENKIRSKNDLCKRDSRIEAVMNDFQKIKAKVNRFSGTYKNVLYKEIEKSIEKSLTTAKSITKDVSLIANLNDDAEKYLRILEEKSIKEYSSIDRAASEGNSVSEDKNVAFTEIAVQLSRMRQNLRDITDSIDSSEPQNLESNKELEHRINMNILELSSINIASDEPFYHDKENLRQEFLKLSSVVKENISALEGERPAGDGQSSSKTAAMRADKDTLEEDLSSMEENLKLLREQIHSFADEKNSTAFFNIDEALTKLSMNVDKITAKRKTPLHKRKVSILKNIYELCEELENKAQSYEILQNIEKRMIEVRYRLDNFHDLSEGDYNALYRELVDLGVNLEQLNVSQNILEKKNACQTNIKECLGKIENRKSSLYSTEDDSDGGTEI